MKYILLILLSNTFAMAQISDDFSDGNFNQNPTWYGTISHFEIDSFGWLHLNAPAQPYRSYLCLESNLLENTLWEMSVKMDFNPSSSNYLDWYLLANDTMLEASHIAYFIRVGGTNDEIALYKREAGIKTKIIESNQDIVNNSPVEIHLKAERKIGGEFSIWVDLLDGGDAILLGSFIDTTEINTRYSGVNCTYTSTRSSLFYFDDFKINGSAFIDSIAPKLIHSEIISPKGIKLTCKSAELLLLSNEQFNILPSETSPVSTNQIENSLYLYFQDSLPVNTKFSLKIKGLCDTANNCMSDTLLDLYIQNHRPFDIVINEIMIDPAPQVQLENVEYIELFNRADYSIHLKNWVLIIDKKEYYIDSVILKSKDYLVLFNSNDAALFDSLANFYLPFTNLNNTEGYIGLFDANTKIIHEVLYQKDWYKNNNKENGGWSLEMIDNDTYCLGELNWSACINNRGGSPGAENSVYNRSMDTSAPYLVDLLITEEDEIQLLWSENLYDSMLYEIESYGLTDEISPNTIEHFMNQTTLRFADDIAKNKIYTLQINQVKDCSNNSSFITHDFVLGIWPETGQIIINEILFNPKTNGFDYVELYNKSDDHIDASKLLLGNYDTLQASIIQTEIISDQRLSIPPKSYFVVCEDTTWLGSNYLRAASSIYIQPSQVPSLPNTNGHLAVSDIAFNLLDEVAYSEQQHFALLDEVDGVALERLNPNSSAWFSAASKDNYGTPGRINSHFTYPTSSGSLTVTPEVFSPDNDGYNDLTTVKLNLKSPAKTSVIIYDRKGYQVKKLSTNELVNKEATWVWDGLNSTEQRLPIGIYILVCETRDEQGTVKLLKKPIVIASY